MSKTLRIFALVLALSAAGIWLASGGNRGWTKTSVPVKTVDEITGLEAINGSASGISGTVTFDPANPAATKGKIVVAAASLHVPNPMMKEHLHGEQWLNVAKHQEITFEVISLSDVKSTGDSTTADVTGTLSIKGVARQVASLNDGEPIACRHRRLTSAQCQGTGSEQPAQAGGADGLPLSCSLSFNEPVPASQRLLFPDPRPLVERLGLDFFRQLPGCPGVYLMKDAAQGVLYVGKAKNLRQRLAGLAPLSGLALRGRIHGMGDRQDAPNWVAGVWPGGTAVALC